MPGALVADEMGLGKTFTSVAVPILCKLVTEKVVLVLPQSILWGNSLEEWVILAHNDFPSIVGEEQEWYLLQRLNSVPRRLLEIQSIPPHAHPALISALELILVVIMPRVAETFKSVIDKMAHGTNFKLVNLLHTDNANLTNEDLNTSIDEPEYRWNIHLVSYDTLTSRVKPASNGQLSYCVWSYGIFDESHQYKTKNSVGWQIVMTANIEFNLQLTATPGFYSLYDWCFQTMWLFSGAPDNPEDDTVMEKHRAEALYSAVESLMHAIRTEDKEARQDAVHWMIQIAKPWRIRRLSESKRTNGKPLIRIPKENAPLSAPPPQKAVLFCPLPGQVRHLKWCVTKFFGDNVDIFHMYAEMGNDERTEMQLHFQYLQNPSVFITTPKVGRTGLTLTAANHAVITQKFWVLIEQQQAFA